MTSPSRQSDTCFKRDAKDFKQRTMIASVHIRKGRKRLFTDKKKSFEIVIWELKWKVVGIP